MTPEAAVMRLVEILVALPDCDEEDIYVAMAQAGIPAVLADRTYKFTQIAWGRFLLNGNELLDDLGITFSTDYVCLDANGNILEAGELVDDPSYSAAQRLALRYAGSKGGQNLIMMSAEFGVVNDVLRSGGKTEGLNVGTACLFMEAPTEEGMKKASEIAARSLQAMRKNKPAAKSSKPWWRFW